MNIDEHPQIAGQLGVQSIPAVFAFQKGQPVDGFMGALPESQVKGFIERLVGPLGPSAAEDLHGGGRRARRRGRRGRRGGALRGGAGAGSGACRRARRPRQAASRPRRSRGRQALPRHGAGSQGRATRRSPARAPRSSSPSRPPRSATSPTCSARVEADPADHQARFDLALALNARGKREEAVDHLLEIVRRDRSWNEDGARKQLVQFFEAWGPTDEMTLAGRRKLSSILFA